MSDHQVRDLVASLGGLTIDGNHNTINVVVTAGGRSQAAAEEAEAEATSKGAKSKAKAKATAKSEAKAKAQAKKRYYVICHCSKNTTLKGIWHCSWNEMCGRLPGNTLFGSSARPCQGFDTLEDAVSCWHDILPEEAHVLREP